VGNVENATAIARPLEGEAFASVAKPAKRVVAEEPDVAGFCFGH
jgi:hypothetical protein